MGKYNEEGGQRKLPALRGYLPNSLRPGASSDDSPRNPIRNKVLAAVVATGAVAAVGAPLAINATGSEDTAAQAVQPVVKQQSLGAPAGGPDGPQSPPPAVELHGAQDPANAPAPPQPEAKSKPAPAPKEQAGAKSEPAPSPAEKKAQQQAIEDQIAKKKAYAAKKAAEQKAAEQEAAPAPAPAPAAKAAPAPQAKAAPAPSGKLTQGHLTSGYHSRGGSHAGIDIGAGTGTPIHAPTGGEVISSGPASGFGKWVRVQHDDGKVTVYGHINTSSVSVGQRVEAGQQIATVGSRGQSTGPHLHFEVRLAPGGQEINPLSWLQQYGISY
ncbi:murein DD-endopeptidase MepM/ murein hydrolase activator NlpD [Saccharopolyspora lacisalsi]|uniref:Murein DD-endopeptidase MepM/ murein hydrolase activator NlpD n=1 Tax=Halosaccharopolyspora lacisalsi TaxID=1000566 RepID=A0A839DWH9_9PSEU|nr:M23 family metallopeptidase [Halosaccharopolyspora lacisalsi]MBA8825864.1 murein DD-endopeptidase MepM/ murein hydrolase activator NlpD [Halosaccharopolyspora lacisalsi]